MTNGEKFKEVFKISQVDEGELYAYVWLPNHDAAEISIEWWNAEYQESTTKNDLGVDCISRQAAIDVIYNNEYKKDMRKELEQLPPVTPKEKTGHWIDDEFGSKCSCCSIHTHLDKFDRPMKFKYCSMCGAKMVESQESIEKESIPYLMHKKMGVPISECQKAYDAAIEYLRGRGKLKG